MLKKLKTELFANDIIQDMVCEQLGKSQTYVTNRMTGKKSFSLKDAYLICDMLELPYSNILELFPKDDLRKAK